LTAGAAQYHCTIVDRRRIVDDENVEQVRSLLKNSVNVRRWQALPYLSTTKWLESRVAQGHALRRAFFDKPLALDDLNRTFAK